MYTPWGPSDGQKKIADGIVEYDTPSHGGIWLSDERQAQLPADCDNFLHDRTWWEEDCDWVVPFLFFQDDIRKYGAAFEFESNLATAYTIAAKYHPEIMDKIPAQIAK